MDRAIRWYVTNIQVMKFPGKQNTKLLADFYSLDHTPYTKSRIVSSLAWGPRIITDQCRHDHVSHGKGSDSKSLSERFRCIEIGVDRRLQLPFRCVAALRTWNTVKYHMNTSSYDTDFPWSVGSAPTSKDDRQSLPHTSDYAGGLQKSIDHECK